MALKEKGIAAEYLSSSQTSHTKNKVHFRLFCFWSSELECLGFVVPARIQIVFAKA